MSAMDSMEDNRHRQSEDDQEGGYSRLMTAKELFQLAASIEEALPESRKSSNTELYRRYLE
jgi:hypothetical protein